MATIPHDVTQVGCVERAERGEEARVILEREVAQDVGEQCCAGNAVRHLTAGIRQRDPPHAYAAAFRAVLAEARVQIAGVDAQSRGRAITQPNG
jgi:hypothetical protein